MIDNLVNVCYSQINSTVYKEIVKRMKLWDIDGQAAFTDS